MASVGVVIVGLDVADAAVIVFNLTLNNKVGVIGSRQIKVIVAGDLAIERDLEVLVPRFSDRNVIRVESQWGVASVLIIRSQLDSDCLKARVKATVPYRVSIGVARAINATDEAQSEKIRGVEITAVPK